jgi:tetratricopeptide (TPR) repeat protein
MNKDYKIALEDGKAMLTVFPKSSDVIKTMFTVYMANNDIKSASDMITSYPYNEKSAYDIAEYSRMLMIVGRWDEGLSKLKTAWEVDKDEYKIYDVLSQSFSYNKDILSEKLTALSTKNPTDIAYKMWLAKIYSMNVDTSEQANSLLNSIGSLDAGKIEVKLIKASIYQNMGKTGESDELINSVIKQYPNDYRVLHTAGWYYLNKKDYDKALKYCKESIVKNKNYPDNYGFLMPEILKAEGESLEGEPYFRVALSKEPYNYNIMLNVANFYWITSKNVDKSIEYFKMAEIIKPSDSEIKFSMANVYLNAGKIQESIDCLNQSIKIDDSVPKYHRMLGTIYLTQKNPTEGIKEIRLAYHADEQDILTLSNAGCYYITYEADLERGIYNLQKAAEGLNASTDSYTKDKINDNFKKAKDLKTQYSNAKSNDKLKIPEFTLFY